jgi:hypothetical protein
LVLLVVLLAPSGRAGADERNALYVELLGKGGLWGLGYDRQLHARWAVGAAASHYVLDHEHITSFSPYVAAYPAGGAHHRWFVHAGPQLVRVAIPSPVPEWSGSTRLGIGAELCTGYELRYHALVRVYVMATAGRGGVAPWAGVSVGWAL